MCYSKKCMFITLEITKFMIKNQKTGKIVAVNIFIK